MLMSVDARDTTSSRFQSNDGYSNHRPRSTSQANAVRKTNGEGRQVQPSFPLKVFRREKIPQKKRLYEQFRSSTIPDNEDWKEAAGRVLPSSLTDWRAANMLRGDHSYLKKFIYSNFINEAKETFAQLPLPFRDFELSGVCESILDWLNELSFLKASGFTAPLDADMSARDDHHGRPAPRPSIRADAPKTAGAPRSGPGEKASRQRGLRVGFVCSGIGP